MSAPDTQKVLVGLDAHVYTVAYGGLDAPNTVPSFGAPASLKSIWKDIKVSYNFELFGVTSSSGVSKEKRRGPFDWKATMSNMVRSSVGGSGGAGFLFFAQSNDFVKVVFQEETSGLSIVLLGMMATAGSSRNEQAAMQEMEIEGCGQDVLTVGDGGIAYASV